VNENDFLIIAAITGSAAWTAIRLTGLVLRHRAGQAAATRKQAKETTQ